MRAWVLVIAAVACIGTEGCGASVSVSGGTISGNGPYLAVWERDWNMVERDEKPYAPTSTSAGVCNIGGVKAACYETDKRVSADLLQLSRALREVDVPIPYRDASKLTLRAISLDLVGLRLRMSSLRAGDYTIAQRESWFRQAKAKMVEAHKLSEQGYVAFPEWARPMPAPSI